jgi:hypothetical protein
MSERTRPETTAGGLSRRRRFLVLTICCASIAVVVMDISIWALCAFGAFLFVTTLYLQDVRGLPALTAGLCLLPAGLLVVVLSPFAGRLAGTRGPRLPLVAAGGALALDGGASLWLGPATPLPGVLAV